MKVKQILLLIVLAICCMNLKFSCNISSGPPEYTCDLAVPFLPQECYNYCGVACVQMWAVFDGWHDLTQDTIAEYMGISPGGNFASPYEMERAVGAFTASYGWLERREWYELGSQGDLISSTVEGLKWGFPSIMPILQNHAVVIKGSNWIDKNERPYAVSIRYHDPSSGANIVRNAQQLRDLFEPAPDYWVILGWEDFVINGIIGHDLFVQQGGTYYGGPAYYNPKNLDLTQPVN